MNEKDLDQVYHSLLKCVIGTISTIDVLTMRELYDKSDMVDAYSYHKALEDHCGMSMYDTGDIQ